MTTISHRVQEVLMAINAAKVSAGSKKTIQLVAVSKAQSAEAIREAAQAGLQAFGENYVQEAVDKQAQLLDLNLTWHFIGPIQSNKTQLIAKHFAWVHGVDRLKIAQRLSDARGSQTEPLQICIQVNVSEEASKSGVMIHEALPLAQAISTLPNLRLRGIMAIPEPSDHVQQQHAQFKAVAECFEHLNTHGFALDTLSMGMSNDFTIAIAEGANIVRIGSAIFGARLKPNAIW